VSLAARLRRKTSDAHRAAERSALVVEMMAGRLQRGRYVLLLRNLLPVYQLLEGADDPVLRAYRDRVAELAGRAPLLLAAHAYVRYLGDLSGGRMLGRAMRRSLGVSRVRGPRVLRVPRDRECRIGPGPVPERARRAA
jgi:heme oxygenase (biliverdin-producing, ferredoxin)